MTPAPPRWRWGAVRPLSLSVFGAAAGVFGYLSGFPAGAGLAVVLVAVGVAEVLRSNASPSVAAFAPVPAVLGLVVVAVGSPAGLGIELFAGLAGLALLLWLADDPFRPVGGDRRSLPALAIPALALGIAWSSALFLPAGAVPLGVAGGLLALALAAVALLLGRPTVFDREEA